MPADPASSPTLLPPETGKRRNARILLNYSRGYNSWESWKALLAIAGALAGLAWCAYLLLAQNSSTLTSRGPLANPHAIWDQQCQACHVDFTPINGELLGLQNPAWHRSAREKCQACHRVDAHHANSLYDAANNLAEAGCASCHRDHQGREFDLTRVADSNCTVCHANLAAHTNPAQTNPELATAAQTNPAQTKTTEISAAQSSQQHATKPPFKPKVESFDQTSHAEFRSLKTDPGRIKFPHGVHMAAGISRSELKDGKQSARRPWTLESFASAADRTRYQNQTRTVAGQELVQLQCNSCHEIARREPLSTAEETLPGAVNSLPGAGESYLPVIFERHCAACHHLDFYFETQTAEEFVKVAVPHRSTANELGQFLSGVLVRQALGEPNLQEDLAREYANPVPGNPPPEIPLAHTLQGKLANRLGLAARLATQACAFCHLDRAEHAKPIDLPDHAGNVSPAAHGTADSPSTNAQSTAHSNPTQSNTAQPRATEQELQASLGQRTPERTVPQDLSAAIRDPASTIPGFPTIAPTNIPLLWFRHARFDHAAHRGVSCRECHAGAFADTATASNSSADILIPKIDNCVQCHAPASQLAVPVAQGAGTHCTECHRYHGGDDPLRGRSAQQRTQLDQSHNVRNFLQGITPPSP
jgi:hypothetical protein